MTKTYVIADIHGRLDLLQRAADKIPPGSKVVLLGDYVDRGPDSAGVVAFVKGSGWVALKGNHEDMMAQNSDMWIMNGGDATVDSYADDVPQMWADMAWMRALPTMHEDEHRVYVHAQASDDDRLRLWGRVKGDDGWRGKHVVHGHTPKLPLELLQNRTNLDAGAVFTGHLAIGIFDDALPGGPVAVIYA